MDRISKALERANLRSDYVGTPGDENEANKPVYVRTATAVVGQKTLAKNKIINRNTAELTVDAYRLLRTRVLQRMRQNGWNTLGISSAMPREGKSLTAVNLGVSIAQGLTQTALLVDADLRKPSIHQLFGIEPRFGLGDYLLADTKLEQILINPDIDRLVLLPGRSGASVSSEHLTSPRMEALAIELKHRYRDRIVIYDLPPVLIGDDVVAFAPHVDAILMVVSEGQTGREQFQRAFELLEGVPLLGTVLNKSEHASASYEGYY